MKPITDMMQKSSPEATTEVKDDQSSPCRNRTAFIGFGALAMLLIVSTVIGVITFVRVRRIAEQEESIRDVNAALERERVAQQEEYISDVEKMTLERMMIDDANVDTEDETLMDEDAYIDTEDDTVEANITYHLPLSETTIEEKVVVTNDEEDITTPEMRVIFDYSSGYVVTHFHKDGNGSDVDICFVRKFTPRQQTSRIKSIVKTEKRDEVVTGETTAELYTSTGESFDRNLLSRRASAMCQNSRMVRTKKTKVADLDNTEGESATRRKRTTQCSGYVYCGSFCVEVPQEKVVQTCHTRWFRRSCSYVRKKYTTTKCFSGCHCISPY